MVILSCSFEETGELDTVPGQISLSEFANVTSLRNLHNPGA